ncbi:nucleotidyltransferase [Stetteria hydrogenophila]
MVSRREFAAAVRLLVDAGFRFTVIGGTVVELALNSRDLGDDIDVFAESPQVLGEEEVYMAVAEEKGWEYGQTWLGTPRLGVRVGESVVPVEFYDNLYDFYVPPLILERATTERVEDAKVKMVTLEDHLVLKANAGRQSDLERLAEIGKYVKRGRLRVDRDKIFEAASEFDDPEVIIRRLRDAGVL